MTEQLVNEQIANQIAVFERVSGARVCIHDYSRRLRPYLGPALAQHFNPYCSYVKQRVDNANARCMACDMKRVQERLAGEKTFFIKCCHGGVVELVFPLVDHGRLAGALFVGPFRWEGAEMPDTALVQTPGSVIDGPLAVQRDTLRGVNETSLADIQWLGSLLVFRLDAIPGEVTTGERRPQDFKNRAEEFLAGSFARPLRLRDLAAHLCLSASRTSQLLRKHLGVTFPALLLRYRCDYCKDLLARTVFPADKIAREAGFRDVAYFHRVFRKSEGLTPGEFRRKAHAEF